MHKCKYFVLKELVAPALLKKTTEKILWNIFDDRLLRAIDDIRSKYGPCTVNANGLTDCGLRDFTSNTGAAYSAHKFGRACDLHIRIIETVAGKIKDASKRKEYKVQEYNRVRKELMKDKTFDVLSFEDNISWLHVDTYNRDNRLYNP